jgi:hypothetical protein
MYLHCHNCDWSQDDFYHEDYNPTVYLEEWNKYLFGEGKHKLDKPFTDDAGFLRRNGNITMREVIAREYEKYAKSIRQMRWITFEDFENEKEVNKVCPKCGKNNLDLD